MVVAVACGQPAPTPAPPAAEPTWRHIATYTGHGNGQLETFPIERMSFRVHWETNNESPAGSGTFYATVHSGDSGRTIAEIADTKGVGQNTTYVTELPHRYYFVVASNGVDWKLSVEEPVYR